MLDSPAPDGADQRRAPRAQLHLLGRYALANSAEFPCQTRDLSASGAALYAPVPGREGEPVVLQLDDIGPLEGRIARVFVSGFAIEFLIPQGQQDRLAGIIATLKSGGRRN